MDRCASTGITVLGTRFRFKFGGVVVWKRGSESGLVLHTLSNTCYTRAVILVLETRVGKEMLTVVVYLMNSGNEMQFVKCLVEMRCKM